MHKICHCLRTFQLPVNENDFILLKDIGEFIELYQPQLLRHDSADGSFISNSQEFNEEKLLTSEFIQQQNKIQNFGETRGFLGGENPNPAGPPSGLNNNSNQSKPKDNEIKVTDNRQTNSTVNKPIPRANDIVENLLKKIESAQKANREGSINDNQNLIDKEMFSGIKFKMSKKEKSE